jgi:hypothetical protein
MFMIGFELSARHITTIEEIDMAEIRIVVTEYYAAIGRYTERNMVNIVLTDARIINRSSAYGNWDVLVEATERPSVLSLTGSSATISIPPNRVIATFFCSSEQWDSVLG